MFLFQKVVELKRYLVEFLTTNDTKQQCFEECVPVLFVSVNVLRKEMYSIHLAL